MRVYENIDVEGFHGIVCIILVKIIKKRPSSRKGIRSGSFYTKWKAEQWGFQTFCDYYKAARRNVKLSRAIPDTWSYSFYWSNPKPYIRITSVTSCASLVQNPSYENKFDLHENKPVGETHFHMKDFARGKRQFKNGLIWSQDYLLLFTTRIKQWKPESFVWATLKYIS